MTCALCDRPVRSRGWCALHYDRFLRYGDASAQPQRAWNRRSLMEQFAAQVRMTSGCWLWTGPPGNHGYGRLRQTVDGRAVQVLAHRFSYELFVGPIADGLTIDHLCRTRLCVHPLHLEPVTLAENTKREWDAVGDQLRAANPRRTHCQRGHALTGANVVIWRDKRQCRVCKADRARARRLAAKEIA